MLAIIRCRIVCLCAADFLNGWLNEALGDEVSRFPKSEVAEGM
jgi:hypothetical protein